MRKTIKPVFIVILLILIALAIWHSFFYHPKHPVVPTQPIPVKVAAVAQYRIPMQVKAVGQVMAPETIMLSAKQAGSITGVYFKSGESVKRGQLLLTIDDTSQRAALAQQLASLRSAETVYNRYKRLVKNDPSAVSDTVIATQLGKLKVAEALVNAAKKNLADTRIIAPFSGVIGHLQSINNAVSVGGQQLNQATQLAVGTYLQVNSPLAILSNPNKMVVLYQIPQTYSQYIKVGQPVALKASAFPGKTFNGAVVSVSPVVLQTSQAFSVQADIQNTQNGLVSGMNGMVTQTLLAEHTVLAVPGLSLVPSLSGYDVYMIEEGKVKAVPVTVGQRYKNLVAIKSGLKAGDEIIISGVSKVHPGSLVKVVK